MIVAVAVIIRRNMGVPKPRFTRVDTGVSFAEIYSARPDRLYLGAGQHDTRLNGFVNEIVVDRHADFPPR